jgi:membrane-associated phospholipid phosphatase
MDSLRHLDDRLLLDVNALAHHTGWLHALLIGYARYGVLLFMVLLLAGALTARGGSARTLTAVGWACLATVLAVAVNQPVGRTFHEARPYAARPQLLVLAGRTTDFSFPSDRAAMAGAAAVGFLLVFWRLGLLSVGAVLLMAFARVYIGAHYQWDVAAGLALGTTIALLGWLMVRVPLTALTAWLRRRPALRAVFAQHPPAPAEDPAPAGRVSSRP